MRTILKLTRRYKMFEYYKDKKGEFRFRLKARNGRILCQSEGYKTEAGCLNGIDSVRNTVANLGTRKEKIKKVNK